MKPIYLKHRSGHWVAMVSERQAEIFTTGHIFGFSHDFNHDQTCLKQWLTQGLSGEGVYRISAADEFENARQAFIRHALSLVEPALIQAEAKQVFLRIIEEEEARA